MSLNFDKNHCCCLVWQASWKCLTVSFQIELSFLFCFCSTLVSKHLQFDNIILFLLTREHNETYHWWISIVNSIYLFVFYYRLFIWMFHYRIAKIGSSNFINRSSRMKPNELLNDMPWFRGDQLVVINICIILLIWNQHIHWHDGNAIQFKKNSFNDIIL